MGKTRDFVFVGNQLAVDFSNTIKMVNNEQTDLLTSPHLLCQWAKTVEIYLTEQEATLFFDDVIRFRDIIHEILMEYTYKELINSDYLEKLNTFIQQHQLKPYLSKKSSTSIQLSYTAPTVPIFLCTLVEAAIQLLSNQNMLTRLKHCEHEDCILLFIDLTKSRTKRWCSMKICGNKVKASKFYKRSKSESLL